VTVIGIDPGKYMSVIDALSVPVKKSPYTSPAAGAEAGGVPPVKTNAFAPFAKPNISKAVTMPPVVNLTRFMRISPGFDRCA
jgi:hypothetical protein